MPRSRAYETPGWTQNLIRASRVQPGERAVVLGDEPLGEEGPPLLAQLEGAREVHVRGAAGTYLKLRVEGRPWRCDALPLEAGGFANYPNGEVYVAPHADGADGLLVVDLTVPYTVAGLVDEPVRL